MHTGFMHMSIRKSGRSLVFYRQTGTSSLLYKSLCRWQPSCHFLKDKMQPVCSAQQEVYMYRGDQTMFYCCCPLVSLGEP